MLRLYNLEGQENCWRIGRKHINDRLIEMMEYVMADYAQLGDPSYTEHITSSAEWDAPLEKVIDLERMRNDKNFVEEGLKWIMPLQVFKTRKRMLTTFWRMYDLLKAEEEFKPDLVMEYVLYRIIETRLEDCKMMPEAFKRVERIPEPGRTEMLKELSECVDDESTPEDLMAYYEDLEHAFDVCFEDNDCLLLEKMSERAIRRFAKAMRIHVKGDFKTA